MPHKKYYPPLLPGRFFHVFNRGNNGDNLFYQERNYAYFLRKYFEYLSPVLDTYCYSLLPNHFHILARVKEEDVVIGHKRDAIPPPATPTPGDGIPSKADREKEAALWVSERFRRFFLGYSQAIRKQEGRSSSLFQKNFKRLEVDSESYLINLVLYIHANAQLHGLCTDFREYGHSSFDIFSQTLETPIRRDEVLEWFGSYPAFVQAHLERVNLNLIDPVLIEEDLFTV